MTSSITVENTPVVRDCHTYSIILHAYQQFPSTSAFVAPTFQQWCRWQYVIQQEFERRQKIPECSTEWKQTMYVDTVNKYLQALDNLQDYLMYQSVNIRGTSGSSTTSGPSYEFVYDGLREQFMIFCKPTATATSATVNKDIKSIHLAPTERQQLDKYKKENELNMFGLIKAADKLFGGNAKYSNIAQQYDVRPPTLHTIYKQGSWSFYFYICFLMCMRCDFVILYPELCNHLFRGLAQDTQRRVVPLLYKGCDVMCNDIALQFLKVYVPNSV